MGKTGWRLPAGMMAEIPEQIQDSFFQKTDRSQLRHARLGDLSALSGLIAIYQKPLRVYLLHAFPSLHPHVEELLQDFAQDKLLTEAWLGQVDLERGRFRDFLKTSLRNYVLNWLRRQKRRQEDSLSIEDEDGEGLDILERKILHQPDRASDAYDLECMRMILTETLRRMEDDCRQPGKNQPRRAYTWEIFNLRLLTPAFHDAEPPPYEDLVTRFQLRSPAEGTNLLLSAKRIFERHLFDVVAERETNEGPISAELDELKKVLVRLVGRK